MNSRRKFPRLTPTSAQFKHQESGKIYSTLDLSAEGLALLILDSKDFIFFTLGASLEGTLNLKREKHAVTLKVCSIGKERIGCIFVTLEQSLRIKIQQLLDPEKLAQELKIFPSLPLDQVWYHGSYGTDLFFIRGGDEGFQSFIFYILGSFIGWDTGKGLRTGEVAYLDEKCEEKGIFRYETLELKQDSEKSSIKLGIAKTLVLSSKLPQELKQWCIERLEE